MRTLLRVGLILLAAVGALLLALIIVFPANRTAEEGPADPVPGARKKVVGVLTDLGIVSGPFFGVRGLVPRRMTSEVGGRLYYAFEGRPVYRGLFWLVGHRIRFRLPGGAGRRLRVEYILDGERQIAAESRPGAGEVCGFVPACADMVGGFEVDETGRAHEVSSFGSGPEFSPPSEKTSGRTRSR